MAKRFTDSLKWNDDWYISLTNDYKVIWQWLLDNCNHAGICKRSISLLNLMCKTSVKEDEMIKAMAGRIIKLETNWFIPKYLKFQYSTLLSEKPAVVSVVKELFSNDCVKLIPESFGDDYRIIGRSFQHHLKIVKDKDKDKDKDNRHG